MKQTITYHLKNQSNNQCIKEKAEMASNNNGGQEQNVEIINRISYIEKTMKTLKREQLKIQLDTNLI